MQKCENTKCYAKQLDFMKSIANSVKPVLAAVIVMKQIPFVALDFGHHSAAAIDAFIARNRQYAQDSNTYNGYSLHLARQLMQKQTSKHKVIIFIGDGGYDNTEYADIYPDLEMANAARREGIRILYLAIGEYVDPYSPNYARTWHQHALRLAGGEENYIQIADFDDLVGDKMFEVVKQLCRIVY
ncbi:hypothetical protein ANCCEY_02927 [Ancylostoma ceylanicum]|uniref:VWFA domain-containing protein n=1 Tax=Ancylostoma ceylanicum TaxID=53326 RepID=A0A0D6M6A4_9BILA|nr:hypothetical protein ANCCEY_02927 [Ancylostoma ceylanicum]